MQGVCKSLLLGEPWSTWLNIGAACPMSIPLRSRIYIEELNKSFYCVDRGGAIQDLPDGSKFIDLLQKSAAWYPDAVIVTDRYCPSGCFLANGYVLE